MGIEVTSFVNYFFDKCRQAEPKAMNVIPRVKVSKAGLQSESAKSKTGMNELR